MRRDKLIQYALQAALVVYDEIHYLRDKERGVVWEESIVLMPKSVRFAFLSATIPTPWSLQSGSPRPTGEQDMS